MANEEHKDLDLTSWKIAFNGAEPVRLETMQRFARDFARYGFQPRSFYPCYGLAESTLMVTGGMTNADLFVAQVNSRALEAGRIEPSNEPPCSTFVASGRVMPGTDVAIVNAADGSRLPENQVGEIWVCSLSVAAGYWGHPAESEQTFRARIKGDNQERHYLRTGDLGFIQDGWLFVTGRLRDLIIVRGQNHHAEDIEWTVRSHQFPVGIGAAAACAIEVSNEEKVFVFVEVDPRLKVDQESLCRDLREVVAERHEIPVYAVVLLKTGSIPKTSSGKIQRHECRRGFMQGSLEPIYKSVQLGSDAVSQAAKIDRGAILALDTEQRTAGLADYVQALCAMALRVDFIEPSQKLTSRGLYSHTAMEIKSQIAADLDVEISLARLLNKATFSSVADVVFELFDTNQPRVSGEIDWVKL